MDMFLAGVYLLFGAGFAAVDKVMYRRFGLYILAVAVMLTIVSLVTTGNVMSWTRLLFLVLLFGLVGLGAALAAVDRRLGWSRGILVIAGVAIGAHLLAAHEDAGLASQGDNGAGLTVPVVLAVEVVFMLVPYLLAKLALRLTATRVST